MPVAAVEVARDLGQRAQLARVQFTVRHRHAQHWRMTLHVPAVLQPQRSEFLITELAGLVAFELVAKLRGALVDELSVKF